MKDSFAILPGNMRSGLLCASLAVFPLLFSASICAQTPCPDGSDLDALGCASALPFAAQQPTGPAALNVEERPNTGTPSADNSSEASAVNSLSAGQAFTEQGRMADRLSRLAPSTPEPQSEFQEFVAASTGKSLAIFGANLFETAGASFDPVLDGPAPAETIIGPGDELRIRVWGQVNFSANLIVSRQGDIYLPKVGSVHVAGLPFSAITAHLMNVVNGVYHNYEMTVDLGEIHSIQIYMTGLARRPGAYTVSALSTLVDAVFKSGGPTAEGSMRHVLLKRDGRVLADYDLYKLIVDGDKSGDVQLQPGDILYIPPAGAQVALLGSVRQPAIYELRGAEPISKLLEAAGGETTIASHAKLTLERIDGHSSRIAVQVSQDASGLAMPLADGDIVRVDSIESNFKQTVTLRGAVANPGRFTWHQGLRLSDLIPDKDAVVKRDYWWYRTRLGLPTPELAEPAERDPRDDKPAAITSPAAQTNWNYAVIERLDPATMKTTLVPFSLGKLVLDHDANQDLELQPDDVVTIFSQSDIHIPLKEQTKYIRLEGEFVHPGIYSIGPDDTLHTVVARAGGFTPQAYLYGAVFTRISTRDLEQKQLDEFADRMEHQFERNSLIPSNPLAGTASQTQDALAINHELIARLHKIRASGRIVLALRGVSETEYELPDMQLEDGDTLEVPFAPATVQVVGAVYNPHAFLFTRGLDAGQSLHMAGGPTRDADRRRIYVLRANGSVASEESEPHLFARGLDHLDIHPGDSVIVPEKNVKPSSFNLIETALQSLYQGSISALALDDIK